MKQLFTIKIIQIACLIAANASAIEYPELNEILSESLDIHNLCEKINHQRNAATEELDKKHKYFCSRITWLKQPSFSEERIRHYTDNIAMAKNSIEKLKTCIEFAKITDPNKRATLAQKYDNERQRLLAEEMKAGKPFSERIDELKREFEDKQEPFEQAMKSYCLLPTSNYPSITTTSVDAQFHSGTAKYKWLDKNNKLLAWASISIKDKPVFEDAAEKFDNTFYITKHYPNNIEVWAGNFRVGLYIAKTEWFGKELIVKLTKNFIGLEGLANIDPADDNNSLDALVRGSLACSKRYRTIQNEKHSIVKPLTDKRVKVKALIRRLKKPPADSEQLKKDRSEIGFWAKELENYRGRLDIGTITDPNERAAMIVKLEAEKKKLDAERKRITKPYNDQYTKLLRGLQDKNQLLNDAMKGFFLKGEIRYEGISKTTTRARFSQATISSNWEDDQGNTLCSAQLQLRNPPNIPENPQMLDGVYYVSNGGNDRNFIWVWVGDFFVYFNVNKKEWLEKEKVGEILKSFIDLPRLATAHTG